MRKKSKSAILALVLAGALLTGGCGKSVTVSEELGNISGEKTTAEQGEGSGEGGQTTAGSMPDGLGIPEDLVEVVFESDSKEKKISSAYYVIDPMLSQNHLPVYEMNRFEMDDAHLTKIAEQIFDEGSLKVMKPGPYCTKEELEAEINYLKVEVKENEKSLYGFDEIYPTLVLRGILVEMQEAVEHSTALKSPVELQEMPDGVLPLIYSDLDAKWKETMALVAGTIKGEHYILQYTRLGVDEELVITKMYTEKDFHLARRIREDALEDGSDQGVMDTESDGVMTLLKDKTNLCNESLCVSIAEDVKSRLGREDFMNFVVYEDVVKSLDMEVLVNGYQFEYYPGNELIPGITFANANTAWIDMDKEQIPFLDFMDTDEAERFGFSEDDFAIMESLKVDVRDDRLFSVSCKFKYENYEEMEMAELLPFSKIQETLEAAAVKLLNYAELENSDLPFFGNRVELRYIPVEKKGVSRLVPAWVFYSYMEDSEYDMGWIAIDATNGDVLEFIL